MGKIDLDGLSLQELKRLQKDVAKAVDTYEERQKAEARAAVEAKAREMGFNLNELVEPGKRSSRRVNPPKYRHPENPELTWSGRGRQPGWVKDILASGESLDEYRI